MPWWRLVTSLSWKVTWSPFTVGLGRRQIGLDVQVGASVPGAESEPPGAATLVQPLPSAEAAWGPAAATASAEVAARRAIRRGRAPRRGFMRVQSGLRAEVPTVMNPC